MPTRRSASSPTRGASPTRLARGEVLAPAKSLEEMQRVVFNNTLDAGLCALFIVVLLATVCFGVKAALAARRSQSPTSQESEHVALESLAR